MDYGHWHVVHAPAAQPLAALAIRRAADETLFLETYLDVPIEAAVSQAFGNPVARSAIVEIGCLAATPTPAMLKLWGKAAISLSEGHSVAVATLTLPLRKMFRRVGLPFVELAKADPALLRGAACDDWGRYYDAEPLVCAGNIAAGSAALQAFAPGYRG